MSRKIASSVLNWVIKHTCVERKVKKGFQVKYKLLMDLESKQVKG